MLKRSDIIWVLPATVQVIEGFNVRIDYGDIEELANSIQHNGIKMPLRAYKKGDKYLLTDGHRRLKAALIVEKRGYEVQVPIIPEPRGYNDEDRIFDLIVTNEGKQLTMLEKSEVVKRLVALQYKEKEIAQRMGKSHAHISDLLLLSSASKELKDKIIGGQTSATQVVEMLREHKGDSKEVATKVTKAVETSGGKKATRKSVGSQSKVEKRLSLSNLKTKLEEQAGTDKNSDAFKILTVLIDYQNGDVSLVEVGELFYK